MPGAIFLSASVPDSARAPDYARTADTVAITAAVTALIHVVLGRRRLVWGGHPAITPMIHVIAEEYRVDYGRWVTLYQSRYFADEYPEDNERFRNVIEVDAEPAGREPSLQAMRARMLSDQEFAAAVFIGGMGGIIDEFRLFARLQPHARVVPLASTGGASIEVARVAAADDVELTHDLNYVRLLHERLGISMRERRYPAPDQQPNDPAARLQNPGQAD
jgi:hypothetical protein